MWLRRLVGIVMIITCIGLNILTVLGIVVPDKTSKQVAAINSSAVTVQPVVQVAAPVVQLSGQPTSISAGASSGLTWTTTNNPTMCTASGSWHGEKTAFGSESSGRISTAGNYAYTLSCSNAGGKAEATTTITVGNAIPPAQTRTSVSTPVAAAAVYCGGRMPCYSSHDVGQHGVSGNCWGWNGDRVINISGFDAAFHQVKSGISNIQISQICGHDLAPSLSGGVPAEGRTRAHNQSTKSNADTSEIPYFTGYFDASKP